MVDVTGLTDTRSERGLLGFDFSPDGRFVYLDHTDLGGSVELVEYDLEASPPTRRFLLEIPQFQANHNGGDVHVTSDGLVWASSGDGGSAGDPQNNGQDRSNLLGTIYRIDPTPSGGQPYTVPADNPFVGEAGVSPEIWAYGLRNPWRFDIDEASGMIWIADVGQGAEEEINRHPLGDPGPNFGWKRFEGDRFFADVPAPDPVFPVHTYGHNPECSVSGGVVYAGAIEQLRDAYVFGDWCTGGLSAVRVDAGGGVEAASLGVVAPRVVAFGHDHDGEILVVEFGGRIRRVIEN